MAHRSQCSSLGENPLDANYVPPHYREEYRLAIDQLIEDGPESYYEFLQASGVVDFLSRSEVDHIRHNVQTPNQSSQPELPFYESQPDGSSDTYWPVQSDLEAPGLDLGWPLHHSFIGPTEVTTLVNPPDAETPSIKVHARRLIRNAKQVIGVVMDMFTDVDIFADLLDAAARCIPVYILLDELNVCYFTAMVTSCKVNLAMVPYMRVRTVSGSTYFCRTGKSFKGQVMDRFLLVDCEAALSGNYSFMWSFEKIHRCIAHLFLGELVTTFDEEFRILYAQSKPLVTENELVPLTVDTGNQFSFKRSQSLRNPRGVPFLHSSGFPFGELERNTQTFRREDPLRHSALDMSHMHSKLSHNLRAERSFLEQNKSIVALRQMEMNAFKRHSYAEGTHETYSSSRQFMKQRVMNNLEEIETKYHREQCQVGATGSGQGFFERIRSQEYHQVDEKIESECPPELEEAGHYNRMVEFWPSDYKATGPAPYSQTKPKRPGVGHPYACQSSPTQTQPPEDKHQFPDNKTDCHTQDSSLKQGLRTWRISSYLNNFESEDNEGLQHPMGGDTFDAGTQSSEVKSYESEPSALHFGGDEHSKLVSDRPFVPRYGKPILPGTQIKAQSKDEAQSGRGYKITAELSSITGDDKAQEPEFRLPREISITKHESFRSRLNPMLQRSSRLRSSLIFSSSKLEQHNSYAVKKDSGLDPNEGSEKDHMKPYSIVAQILEKRRSLSRDPFEFSSQKKTDAPESSLCADSTKTNESLKSSSEELARDSHQDQQLKDKQATDYSKSETNKLNDPQSRLLHFQELSAKRKASKMAIESAVKSPEPVSKKPDLADTQFIVTEKPAIIITPSQSISDKSGGLSVPTNVEDSPKPLESKIYPESLSTEIKAEESTEEIARKQSPPSKHLKPFPSPKFFKRDSLKPFKSSHSRRISCGDEMLTPDATDAEKSEMKKSRSHSSSSNTLAESGDKPLKPHGSTTSLNILDISGETKHEIKPLDFFKKHTQRLKGILGSKADKKAASAVAEEKASQMHTLQELSEESSTTVAIRKTSLNDSNVTGAEGKGEKSGKAASKPVLSRYQLSTSNVLYSSNLRDDTKVILEQISANNQKNRTELSKQSTGATDEAKGTEPNKQSSKESQTSGIYQSRNRFQRTQASPHERDSLLKRIESLRKEKKVYSRFEMGNSLG